MRQYPRLNLKRLIRVVAWNVVSLSEALVRRTKRIRGTGPTSDGLHLSTELSRLRVSVAVYRKSGNLEVDGSTGWVHLLLVRPFTRHPDEVAVAAADRLVLGY